MISDLVHNPDSTIASLSPEEPPKYNLSSRLKVEPCRSTGLNGISISTNYPWDDIQSRLWLDPDELQNLVAYIFQNHAWLGLDIAELKKETEL